jgi:hypothetical protein
MCCTGKAANGGSGIPSGGELGFVQTTLLVALQMEIKLVCLADPDQGTYSPL